MIIAAEILPFSIYLFMAEILPFSIMLILNMLTCILSQCMNFYELSFPFCITVFQVV